MAAGQVAQLQQARRDHGSHRRQARDVARVVQLRLAHNG